MEPGYTPLLSILIPTLAKRQHLFLPLAEGLCRQAEASAALVEVVGLQNAGEQPLATYRERLLHDARGKYLAFVDDDDLAAECYVAMITAALADDPDVVTFPQFCTGTAAPITLFGIGYAGAPWEPVLVNGLPAYVRVFSHVLPVRAEIARKASFIQAGMPGYTQEDQVFAASMIKLLAGAREARLSEPLYCYLYGRAGESTQDGPQADADDDAHERPAITSPCFRWCGEQPTAGG